MAFLKSLVRKIVSVFSKPSTSNSSGAAFKWLPEWTEMLRAQVTAELSNLSRASDILTLRADYKTLSDEKRVAVWVEFFKTLSYYECGYNPNLQNVDVGTKDRRDSWSIGLFQVSVDDQINYGFKTNFNFQQLLMHENNIYIGVQVLVNQILKRGKIFIPNNEKGNPKAYFATLRPGNSSSKVTQILATVHAMNFNEELAPKLLPWVRTAEDELGQSEIVGSKHNPRIVEYHATTTLKAKDDETAWCASFVCWVLEKSGFKSTKSAWARDFLNYGEKLDEPQYGCIVVFKRGTSSGHVGFWMGEKNGNVSVLGGNQNNKVSIKSYSKSDVLGYRWPVK